MNNIAKIIGAGVIALAFSALTGCGGNGSDNANSAASEGGGDTVVMVIYWGDILRPDYKFGTPMDLGKDIQFMKQSLNDAGVEAEVVGCVFPKIPSQEERDKIPVTDVIPDRIELGPDLSTYIMWTVQQSGIEAAKKLGLIIAVPDSRFDPELSPYDPCDTQP